MEIRIFVRHNQARRGWITSAAGQSLFPLAVTIAYQSKAICNKEEFYTTYFQQTWEKSEGLKFLNQKSKLGWQRTVAFETWREYFNNIIPSSIVKKVTIT